MNGSIILHRKIERWSWYHDSETFHLFCHLLLRANWKENMWQGIPLKRGQLITGIHALSDQTGISVNKVRARLASLERTGEISRKSTNKFSVITVCNYEKYQSSKNTETQTNHKQTTNKPQQLNKDNKDKEKDMVICPKFELFWKAYPRKVKKKDALKIWNRENLSNGVFEKVMSGLERSKASEQWNRNDGEFIPYPTTWLNGERWTDEFDIDEPEQKSRWVKK